MHIKPHIAHHLLLPIDLDKRLVASLKIILSRLCQSKQLQKLAADLEHVHVDAVAVDDFRSERTAIKKVSEETKHKKQEKSNHDTNM